MADVLLVNPKEVLSYYPPLGLCCVAAACERAGFSVDILDASAERLSLNRIRTRIARSAPAVVGIYVTSTGLSLIPPLIQAVRMAAPRARLVAGGPHISACPDAVNDLDIPYGFAGEAERGFVKLCSLLIRGSGDHSSIEGLVWNDGGALRLNQRQRADDLNGFPFPARHLLPMKRYFNPLVPGMTTSIVTSRGCFFKCAYCSKSGMRGTLTYRSPGNVAEELKEVLERFPVRYIEFVDDLFTFDAERVHQIADHIKRESLKFSWGCQTRADRIDEPLVKAMKAAGLVKISFGIETGSELIRYGLGKRISNDSYREAVRLCRSHGLFCTGGFMTGLPGETRKDIDATVAFARELDLDVALLSRLVLLPGSLLYMQAVREGRIRADAWKKCLKEYGSALPYYIPDGMDEKALRRLTRGAYRRIYLRPRMVWREAVRALNPRHALLQLRVLWQMIRFLVSR